jgi:centromere protein X
MAPKPFNPPRPSADASKIQKPKTTKTKSTTSKANAASKPKAKAKATKSRSSALPSSLESSSDPFDSDPEIVVRKRTSLDSELDSDEDMNDDEDTAEEEAEEEEEEEERKESIPPELLTRLLHECFKEEGTRIRSDASVAVGRYMETFVREALARAAFLRAEMDGGGGNGFLEVSVIFLPWLLDFSSWRGVREGVRDVVLEPC